MVLPLKIIKQFTAGMIIAVFGVFLVYALQRSLGAPFPTIFGYGYAQVASGSMEPNIHVGEYVIVKINSPAAIGDVIMYENEQGLLITHRIVQVTENGSIITQGDANDRQDEPVPNEKVVGKVIFHRYSPLDQIENTTVRFSVSLTILLLAALAVRWAFSVFTETVKKYR